MKQVFPENTWEVGEAIMRAESGLNPNSVSSTNDFGCWQINVIHADMTSSVEALFDPAENARIAYSLSNGGKNWTPWTVYKTGAYLKWIRS